MKAKDVQDVINENYRLLEIINADAVETRELRSEIHNLRADIRGLKCDCDWFTKKHHKVSCQVCKLKQKLWMDNE